MANLLNLQSYENAVDHFYESLAAAGQVLWRTRAFSSNSCDDLVTLKITFKIGFQIHLSKLTPTLQGGGGDVSVLNERMFKVKPPPTTGFQTKLHRQPNSNKKLEALTVTLATA